VSIVDADEIAREVVKAGTPAFKQIVARFGKAVVGPRYGSGEASLVPSVRLSRLVRER
jgi:dephospho-CoA kinase